MTRNRETNSQHLLGVLACNWLLHDPRTRCGIHFRVQDLRGFLPMHNPNWPMQLHATWRWTLGDKWLSVNGPGHTMFLHCRASHTVARRSHHKTRNRNDSLDIGYVISVQPTEIFRRAQTSNGGPMDL